MRPRFNLLSLIIACFMPLGVIGCSTSSQSTACYQAITADSAVIQTAAVLYQSGDVSAQQAKSIYTGAATAEAGLYVWSQSLTTQPSAAEPDAVATALANLQTQLQAITDATPAAKARLKAKAVYGQVTPGDVLAIIELAEALEPGIAQFIDGLTASAVTPAQITAALAQLNTDLNSLAASLANPPATVGHRGK